jgi:hypothetical protein
MNKGAIWLAGGILLGAVGAMFATPMPDAMHDEAKVLRVANKVRTAYVLKPPACEPIEHVTIVKEACVSNSAENETQPESTNADETQKPRHRRWRHMRRHRRHW